MLKKENKLTSLIIKDLFNKKDTPFKIIRGIFFDLKVFYKKDNQDFKSAIIISGKIFKKAVERNKIRRQLYSILENFNKENFLQKDIYILIYPKKDIKNIKFSDLQKELYNTIINLLNK